MNDPSTLPAWVRPTIWVAVLAFGLLSSALVVWGFSFLDSVGLGFLLVAMPTLSAVQLPAMRGLVIERMPAYVSSIVSLAVIGGVALILGTRADGFAGVGWVVLPIAPMVGWTLGLTLAALVLIVAFRALGGLVGASETPLLRRLLPVTKKERRVFGLLSFMAGVGEETAYRGYAIPLLALVLGVPGAVGVTSLAFGLMHLYQGLIGVVRTGVMGAVFAWGFLASGSLLPCIAAHVLFDLIAGLLLGDRLMLPNASSGVPSQVPDPPRPFA